MPYPKKGNLGKLRNTVGSATRVFNFCSKNLTDINEIIECTGIQKQYVEIPTFDIYHILNNIPLELEDIQTEEPGEGIPKLFKRVNIFSGPFIPSRIKTAYSISSIAPINRRVIITIIVAFYNPYLVRDVTNFCNYFKLPKCNLKTYNFSKTFNANWATEVTMNVQWAHAINPNCEIRVIFAKSNSFNDILNAINFANNKNNFSPPIDTDVISMSFGSKDNGGLSRFSSYFTNLNTIYVASSGNQNNVSFPSSCSNVLSIGGTSLSVNATTNNRFIENLWSSSGCGFSQSFPKPSYQVSINQSLQRVTPDICGIADPKTGAVISINNRLYSIGGTSLAAPVCGSMLSLVQQKMLNANKPTFTSVSDKPNSIQKILYNLNMKNTFYDVVNGKSGSFSATAGYDIGSGLGVMNITNLLNVI
jgi:subtilase family serine protease